ncbi:hypothetical protein [Amycolatopsis sp. cmx-8-4]|uniref:hypothetical protein n=1 Tax=Amycolatopsis sp. cmx-8-4 TaxID=2790947 RepID=UPI00397B50AF
MYNSAQLFGFDETGGALGRDGIPLSAAARSSLLFGADTQVDEGDRQAVSLAWGGDIMSWLSRRTLGGSLQRVLAGAFVIG